MSKTLKAIKKVAKQMNMSTKDITDYDGRFVLSDGFTTIIASSTEASIRLWAETHAIFIDNMWGKRKSKTYKATSDYAQIMFDKLQQCLRKPEIDIVYETKFEDVQVVVFTDTTDACVEEAQNLRGVK